MNIQKILQSMTLEEKASFVSGGDFWHTRAIDRLGVPAAMMCDGPHGLRKQRGEGDHLGVNESIETVCYPTASALASSFDREVMEKLGDALGQECQAENVAMLLGPGVNIKRSPLCGRNFEYFSEDPYLAGEMAAAYIKSLQAKGIASCVKHFAANSQETLRMTGNSVVDERTLHEIYLPAFESAVKKGGTRSVMCAYNAVNGTFCAENRTLLTDILREKWGFEGFVVTDWGAIKSRAKGIQAGLDLEMPGSPTSNGEEILTAIAGGEMTEAELDQAVLRILRFVSDYLEKRDENARIDRAAMRKLSSDLAAECAVLLKNDGTLPVKDGQRVAFIGEFAETPRYQGAGSSHINVPHAVGALEAAGGWSIAYAKGFDSHETAVNAELMEEAVRCAADADAAIIFAGLPASFETEGCDRDDMALPDNQNALISAVARAAKKTVVVLHGGPVMELPWVNEVNAILLMHLSGERVGEATVRLLKGDDTPSGHLAESWPLKLSDNPSFLNFPGEEGVVEYHEGVFVGYRYYDKKQMAVQYPFGHGLSYTQFAYSHLVLDRERIKDDETLTVTFTVRNTGAVSAKAVPQLYVRDEKSTVRRPVRELKAFEKVALAPGEEKTITFVLDRRAFAYYEPKCHDWFVESGDFTIEIGESSRDLLLAGSVFVEGTTSLPMTITRLTTIGQLMRHPKGAAFVSQMMSARQREGVEDEAAESKRTMGEGAEKMVERAMYEMPLGALISYGRMSAAQLDGLIRMLNA